MSETIQLLPGGERDKLICSGSTDIPAVICSEIVKELTKARHDDLEAIVLTGSLARKEATVVTENGIRTILGDAEFLIVFREGASSAVDVTLRTDAQRVEAALLRREIQCRIDLSQVHPGYFRRLPPHIFSYELRERGSVVWGNPQILSLIPRFSRKDLSREDAWRLTCNRLIELLGCQVDALGGAEEALRRLSYQTLKLYLDLATSLLIFLNAYAPTYGERLEALSRLVRDGKFPGDLPMDAAHFLQRVAECTAWKSFPDAQWNTRLREGYEEAIRLAHSIWRWELMELTRLGPSSQDEALLGCKMRRQHLAERVRGWAYVMRACEWHHSWRYWPHWVKLGLHASPRYSIYFAGCNLVFRLTEPHYDCATLNNWLPIPNPAGHESKDSEWQRLGSAIKENYRRFVVGTRA